MIGGSRRTATGAALSAVTVLGLLCARAPATADGGEEPAGRPVIGTSVDAGELERRMRSAPVLEVRPVGRDAVRLALALEGGLQAELVPRTRADDHAWRAEIAAYRLARALGMDQVPPAVSRRVARDRLEERLEDGFEDAWPALAQRLAWEPDGTVAATLVWRPRSMRALQPPPLRDRRRWRAWLGQDGAGPGEDATLAADLATLVAFDYLTGRTGRLHRGHLRGLPSGGRLFFDRYGAAFDPSLSEAARARLRERLLRVERFPRAFVAQLLRLEPEQARRALASEPGLGQPAVAELLDRRATLLSHVGALVEEHGEAEVLRLD